MKTNIAVAAHEAGTIGARGVKAGERTWGNKTAFGMLAFCETPKLTSL